MRFDAFQIQSKRHKDKAKSDLFAWLLILDDSFLPDWFRLLIKTSIFREEFYNRKWHQLLTSCVSFLFLFSIFWTSKHFTPNMNFTRNSTACEIFDSYKIGNMFCNKILAKTSCLATLLAPLLQIDIKGKITRFGKNRGVQWWCIYAPRACNSQFCGIYRKKLLQRIVKLDFNEKDPKILKPIIMWSGFLRLLKVKTRNLSHGF